MRSLIEQGLAESRRFGLKLGRAAAAADLDPCALRDEVVAGAWDLVVLRLPAGTERLVDELRRLGLEPLQTDTLVTFNCALEAWSTPVPDSGEMHLRLASAQDAQSITRLVQASFSRYPNHYNANPFLDPAAALDGYVEWALAHIDNSECECWIACIDGQPAGLSCSRHDADRGIATGVLHCVDPDFAGRGIYRAMIEASLRHYAARGYGSFRIATQAGNRTVQRLWSRLGMLLESTEATLHLMPLLGLAEAGPASRLSGDAQGDCLDALWRVLREQSPCPVDRMVLARSTDGTSDCRAAVVRSAIRDGRDGLRRRVTVLSSESGQVLAWGHADLRPLAPYAASEPGDSGVSA